MAGAVRVALDLPSTLFESVERERRKSKESRDGFLRRVIADYLERQAEAMDVERDVAAYREHPETEEEVAVTFAMSREALAGEPWE